jgi:ATP-dependent Lon protease
MIVPIFIGRDTTKRALNRAMTDDRRVLAVTQRRSGDDDPKRADLYGVGVIATIIDLINLSDGTIKLLIRAVRRAAIVHLVESPFLAAEVAPMEELRGKDEEASALLHAVREMLKAHRKIDILSSPYNRLLSIDEPAALADAIAPFLSGGIEQKQDILEAADVITRLQKVLALMQTDQQAA